MTFKDTIVFYHNKPAQNYKHRVDYDEKNLQLCLHKVSQRDSGIYKLSTYQNEKVVEKFFHLVVQGEFLFSSEGALSND